MIKKWEEFNEKKSNNKEKIYFFVETNVETYAVRAKNEKEASLIFHQAIIERSMNDTPIAVTDNGYTETTGPELGKKGEWEHLEEWEIVNGKDEYVQESLSNLQKEYREFFKVMLDCYDIKSPKNLPDNKRQEFFDYIKKFWTKGKGLTKSLEDIKKEVCGEDKKLKESVLNENSHTDLVDEYCNKYNTSFYKNFIEVYPTKKEFDTAVVDEILDADTSGEIPQNMTDNEILDEYWDSQIEFSILGQIEGFEDIENDIDAWLDFHNELLDTTWGL